MNKICKCLVLSIIMVIMLGTVGCGAKKEDGIKEFFTAVNKGDVAQIQKFIGEDSKAVKFQDSVQEATVKTIFKHITYKVISEKKDVVEVEITTPNGITLFAEGSNILMEAQIKGENEVKDFPERLENIVARDDFPTVSTNVKIKINKKSEKWVIEKNEELENVITGNLM